MDNDVIELKTETGHIVKMKVIPEILMDINADDNGLPFFSVAMTYEYAGVEKTKKSKSLKFLKRNYAKKNIISKNLNYDHIQVGFIYAGESEPNNHRWMLNFMDVNNNYVHVYYADKVTINCPFTTTSWEDGNWHGRFVIYKKDVKELIESDEGVMTLLGDGDIGSHNVMPIDDDMDFISLRYNIYENTWYCEYIKDDKVIGSIPCKNIISDVPLVGNVDKGYSKPKVTAKIDVNDVSGITVALNALIIKKK
jgi:hypothetical protein